MNNPYILYGRPGWGSAIVEAQLAHYGLPYEFKDSGDVLGDAQAREGLAPLNPLSQVPTLVLPHGQVMTESAAITLYLADVTGSDALVPDSKSEERAAFLRWLVFLVANVYPTFTYADIPERFVKTEGAADPFLQEVNAYAKRLWLVVEAAAGSPHFLGERFSALDIYLAVMLRWRPRAAWFAEHAPRLSAAAAKVGDEGRDAIAAVMERNFPKKG